MEKSDKPKVVLLPDFGNHKNTQNVCFFAESFENTLGTLIKNANKKIDVYLRNDILT
jgi:hypothetical protein